MNIDHCHGLFIVRQKRSLHKPGGEVVNRPYALAEFGIKSFGLLWQVSLRKTTLQVCEAARNQKSRMRRLYPFRWEIRRTPRTQ